MNDLSATDRCVKCGLCLPHCPTFTLSGIEADSPRGRISLMQAIDSPDVKWSPGLFRYLDRCLECRACEAMCPSKVPFGRLMDSARLRMEPHRRRPLPRRWLRAAGMAMVTSPARLRGLGALLHLHRRLGLHRLAADVPGIPRSLKRLNRMLPAQASTKRPRSPTGAAPRGPVDLFLGCIANVLDRRTRDASQRLLEALGYRVNIPAGQVCCGALHQHGGDPARAKRLAAQNRSAFGDSDGPVLVTASGCAAQLSEYGALYGETALGRRVVDITHFLLTEGQGELHFDPLPRTVAVHLPCTHRNVLRQGQDVLAVLTWIPELTALPVNPRGGCCGAAGSYMLTEPEVADQLRDQVVDRIAASGASMLVTTNIGCALHLQAGLRERGIDIDVVHPVVLLERQLRNRADEDAPA
ncbi:MAG: (Fe-S)-binding protein [Gammaproteobacteria bacterium]|jgi:glycolate oxidase iron-sulfur subunit